jgi:NAD-dependent dihydropyrimidine dehydrogenase PreA subunit/nitroreductase
MTQFVVNDAACTRCGQCVQECPSQVIERSGDAPPRIRPENEENCIRCQHCLAVCPSGAVSIVGRDPAASVALAPDSLPTLDAMTNLVRGRRSVRRYRDENVAPALLTRLLAALGNAPTGCNRMALTFSVIDDKDAMQRFRVKALTGLDGVTKAGRLPEAFGFISEAAPAWFERGEDIVFRGAPHLLVVSAAPDAICPQEDVNLALAYFELMAQSAGLGTVWCGLAKMVLELLPDLREMVGVAPGCYYYVMLFGPPAVRYARTVQRDDGARIRRIQVP